MFFKKRNEGAAVDTMTPTTDRPASSRTSKTPDDDDDQQRRHHQPAQHALAHTSTTRSEIQYPSGLKLFLIMLSILVSMFLVALDRLIIATAVPQITDDFHSVTDIGWYGSAYLLTTCAFQLLFGKLYAFFPIKTVFLASIGLFELGSAVCGAAPSSVAFIVGRALAGIGGGGIFAGTIVVMIHSVPLHRRPKYQGAFGAVFGIASVVGPLLGGAFTSKATWRWCFYINLPLGGVALLVIVLVLRPPDQDLGDASLWEKLRQLDFAGTTVLVPGVVCLLLALQWGGVEYAWNNPRMIALLVLAAVLLVSFIAVQILLPETATVPPRIMRNRSIAFASWAAFFNGGHMMIFAYFLPIYFQAIQGVSAVDSGIRTLPLVLSMTVFAIVSGGVITRLGYYTPVMLLGTCILAVGAGLLTTLQVHTGAAKWAGYQVIYGIGMGMSFQAPNLAAQTVLKIKDVPVGTSIMFFSQTLGGAIFISVGQNVLNNELVKRIRGIPGLDGIDLKGSGATTLTKLPAEVRDPVLETYNDALQVVFVVGLVLACSVLIGAGGMEWKSVKKEQQAKAKAMADAEMAETALAGGVSGVVAAAAVAGGQREEKEADDESEKELDDEKIRERVADGHAIPVSMEKESDNSTVSRQEDEVTTARSELGATKNN
ncbi:Major facilitator superfamily transporter [Colletotrichum higginsianum IMI 349063]|uniref:Major facilitator superfamily transporter n=2 Tax=Colletotrichum higginsianum (strain IMI 349063) TaxID=759273 RepID=A0A1B7YI33_COLHI|nr:Major facilitator superfamily transporter [Colletotrichum higginsianum IMI 349063]OBR11716.1 Major facilitator superfamily transporter [Colletotrichum higginsianum IMI 349063]GJC93377.1 major facilitator superfamily transporter [Colletotrichum higginsianum]